MLRLNILGILKKGKMYKVRIVIETEVEATSFENAVQIVRENLTSQNAGYSFNSFNIKSKKMVSVRAEEIVNG